MEKKMRQTHRSTILSLLYFYPGEVQKELVVQRAAKIAAYLSLFQIFFIFFIKFLQIF